MAFFPPEALNGRKEMRNAAVILFFTTNFLKMSFLWTLIEKAISVILTIVLYFPIGT